MDNNKKTVTEITKTDGTDIVGKIMAQRRAKRQAESPTELSTCIITNDTFFIENNPMGCMGKETFIEVILNNFSKKELLEFQLFLQKLSNGENIEFKPLAWTDKTHRDWFFCEFTYKRGPQKYKIPAVDQMASFLVFYQAGLITLKDVTLEGLHDVALRDA